MEAPARLGGYGARHADPGWRHPHASGRERGLNGVLPPVGERGVGVLCFTRLLLHGLDGPVGECREAPENAVAGVVLGPFTLPPPGARSVVVAYD